MNEDPNQELERLSIALISESWGNEQEFSLRNPEYDPSRQDGNNYYVDKVLSEIRDQERIR